MLAAALLCAACGGPPPAVIDKRPTFPAQGVVLLDDQPLRGAVVTLHPLDGAGSKTVRAYARTDAAGKFQLATYEPGDGAIAGKYAVTVYHDADDPGAILPGRYSNPRTSALTVEIKEQPNELPTLRLRRK